MLDAETRGLRMEELFSRIRISPGETIDWRAAREEIHELYRVVTTVERVTLLKFYTIMMDAVERGLSGIAPEDLSKFRETRRQDYNLLLITEAAMPDGNVNLMEMITTREITVGRMKPDDEMRKIAVAGFESLGRRIAEKSPPPKDEAQEQRIPKKTAAKRGSSIWSTIGAIGAMIAFIWLIVFANQMTSTAVIIGLIATAICLATPGGMVCVSWLFSSQYRARYRVYRLGGPLP